MTRFSDNVYSGYEGLVSSQSSRSPVVLTRSHDFAAVGGTTAITRTGTFPPNVQNVAASLFVTQQGSATVSDKITVSAGGTNLITVDQFGSAQGYAAGNSVAGFARITYVASACAIPPVPASNTTNGGEIPYSVTFLPVSADKTSTCRIVLSFNRSDTNTLGTNV